MSNDGMGMHGTALVMLSVVSAYHTYGRQECFDACVSSVCSIAALAIYGGLAYRI